MPATHAEPAGLQVSGTLPLQRLSFAVQGPVQTPLMHETAHVWLYSHAVPEALQISMLVPLQRTVPALHAAEAVQAPMEHACGHCEMTYQVPCASQASTAGAPCEVQRRWPAVHRGTPHVVAGA
jgi:hypothetical protein